MYYNQSVQQFIIDKIMGLVQSYPHIKMLYTYDEYENEHSVQVSPSDFLHSKEWRAEYPIIFKQGYSAFPNEAIGFLGEDSDIITYEKLIFQKQGVGFLSEKPTKAIITNQQKLLTLPFTQPVSKTSIPIIQNSIKTARNMPIQGALFTVMPNISYSNAA
jgi:hypothetical protein